MNAAMKKYFHIGNFAVSVITSEEEGKVLARYMREGLPSPMTYNQTVKEGLPPEVLAEDEEIMVYPMKASYIEIVPSSQMFK